MTWIWLLPLPLVLLAAFWWVREHADRWGVYSDPVRRPEPRMTHRRSWYSSLVMPVYDPTFSQLQKYLKRCRVCSEIIRSCNCYMGVPSNWHTLSTREHSHGDGTFHTPV
jgi:hypothetical protein